MRTILITFTVAALLCLTVVEMPSDVSAVEYYFMVTNCAAANVSITWSLFYGHPGTVRYCDGPKVANDSLTLDINRISLTETFCAANSNMTAYEDWVDCPILYHDFRYAGYEVTRYMPSEYENVTINKVLVVCRFPLGGMPENMLAFRESYWDYWHYSSVSPTASIGTMRLWDVTDTISWTSDMFNDNLTVGIFTSGNVGVSYYLDYLGIVVYWEYTTESPPEDEDEYDTFPEFSLNATNSVPAILGMCGFIGMIALPALGFMAYRNNDEDRISIFVKILAAFMLCLSMFLVSISS